MVALASAETFAAALPLFHALLIATESDELAVKNKNTPEVLFTALFRKQGASPPEEELVLEMMDKRKICPKLRTLAPLLERYSALDQAPEAKAIWERMLRGGLVVGEAQLLQMLHVLRVHGSAADVREVLARVYEMDKMAAVAPSTLQSIENTFEKGGHQSMFRCEKVNITATISDVSVVGGEGCASGAGGVSAELPAAPACPRCLTGVRRYLNASERQRLRFQLLELAKQVGEASYDHLLAFTTSLEARLASGTTHATILLSLIIILSAHPIFAGQLFDFAIDCANIG
jgi:hypothetical protein